MPVVQFQPIRSQPTPEFWTALTSLKLDKLGLDDSVVPVHAWIEEGRDAPNDSGNQHAIGMDGALVLSASAFEAPGTKPSPSATLMSGYFKNFNTIEEFRSPQNKQAVLSQVTDKMLQSLSTKDPLLNAFVLVAFADLKKYTYHYWFAFPSMVTKPAWSVDRPFDAAAPEEAAEIRGLVKSLESPDSAPVYLLKGVAGQRSISRIGDAASFFDGVADDERMVAFNDSSSLPENPGWLLRNALYYLANTHGITAVTVVCLRQGDSSRVGRMSVTLDPEQKGKAPQIVGWERDKDGKLASRVANLGPMLNPSLLAEQAVDLNLKLMRWRIMPELQLDKVSSTKCLLLGAGTLGCYVARALMGWGIRDITFVDSARVSFSNPVRQPLFQFEDCLDGGKPKAECAAARLKQIYPAINSAGYSFMIPMPGHPVTGSSKQAADSVAELECLIEAHDAVFLLMDSRESRWLPTLLGAKHSKVVINAALGFDSYLVMRHGASPGAKQSPRLGCYFCNDVVAPTDSLTDRTLDQMCTVTRPGIAPIAAACAVELLVSLVQHADGTSAPAEKPGDSATASPLGPVPHQIRGSLRQWNNSLIEGHAFDSCTGCSAKVLDRYAQDGVDFLLRVFNEQGYLESVTGLDKLHAEAEAAIADLDWEEGSDASGDF